METMPAPEGEKIRKIEHLPLWRAIVQAFRDSAIVHSFKERRWVRFDDGDVPVIVGNDMKGIVMGLRAEQLVDENGEPTNPHMRTFTATLPKNGGDVILEEEYLEGTAATPKR